MLIEPIIREPYRAESWLTLLSDLFPGADLFNNAQPLDITAPQVASGILIRSWKTVEFWQPTRK